MKQAQEAAAVEAAEEQNYNQGAPAGAGPACERATRTLIEREMMAAEAADLLAANRPLSTDVHAEQQRARRQGGPPPRRQVLARARAEARRKLIETAELIATQLPADVRGEALRAAGAHVGNPTEEERAAALIAAVRDGRKVASVSVHLCSGAIAFEVGEYKFSPNGGGVYYVAAQLSVEPGQAAEYLLRPQLTGRERCMREGAMMKETA